MDTISSVAVAASALFVSVLIVALDPRHRGQLTPLVHVGFALALTVPFVLLAAYTYTSDTPPFMHIPDAFDAWHDRLFAEHRFIGGLTALPGFVIWLILFLLVPVSIGLTYIAALVAAIYLGIALMFATPALVMVPVYATRHILHGTGRLLVLPWLAVLSVIFFLTQPRVVGDLRRRYKKQAQSAAEEAERVQHLNDALAREASRVVKTRWWKPDISIFMSTRHYQKLADYIRALTDVMAAAEEHHRKTKKRNDDERP